MAEEKKKTHLKYKSTKTSRDHAKYRDVRNRVSGRIREIKRGYWEDFSREMENDLYGTQKRIWKMLRASKRKINETVQIKTSPLRNGPHFRKLYAENNNRANDNSRRGRKLNRQDALNANETDPITAARI